MRSVILLPILAGLEEGEEWADPGRPPPTLWSGGGDPTHEIVGIIFDLFGFGLVQGKDPWTPRTKITRTLMCATRSIQYLVFLDTPTPPHLSAQPEELFFSVDPSGGV